MVYGLLSVDHKIRAGMTILIFDSGYWLIAVNDLFFTFYLYTGSKATKVERGMGEIHTVRRVSKIKNLLDKYIYQGINFYDVIKTQVFLQLRNDDVYGKNNIKLFFERLLSFFWSILRDLIFFNRCELNNKYVFVIDHSREDLVTMELEVIQHFEKEEVIIFTENKKVYDKLKYENVPIYNTTKITSLSFNNIVSQLAMLVKIAVKLMFKVDFCTFMGMMLVCVDGVKCIDRYRKILTPDIKSILTLCDAHMNENAITRVANEKGIPTYTLQHGLVNEQWLPVVSDKIFVWGEKTKNKLLDMHVPEEKIVIAGRLLLDKKMEECFSREKEIRHRFVRKWRLNPDKLIVAFFATNWGQKESRGFLETFTSILDLDVEGIVKLRSSNSEKDIKEHISWLNEMGRSEVPVLVHEDIYEIFTAVDVLVTSHSGSAVEAMAFRSIPVILDLYEYMKYPETLAHYDDCVVVKSKEDLRSFIESIIGKKEEIKRRKRAYFENIAQKYFAISQNKDPSKFIGEYILNYSKHKYDVNRGVG